MTSNQIAYKQAKETERSNKEKERETVRSNKAKELEAKKARIQDGAIKLTGLILGGGKKTEANDPSWYNQDPQMVKDVASISFQTPLGYVADPDLDLQVYSQSVANYRNFKTDLKQAGIMCINVVPTIGETGLLNTAGRNIYSYVRHANSGSRNYEYQDLIKYLLAIDSAYIGIQELKRVYALLNTYKAYNKYYAQGYLKALGLADLNLDYSDLANLRYKINQLCLRVNSFYVPNVMTMYNRHAWMAEGIFKDHEVRKSSNYMFHFKYVYKYDETDGSASFGQLVPVDLFANRDLNSIVSTVESIITSLERSEDIGIMSGDILKAYGEGGLFFISTIDADYHIMELFSMEVLSQINNTQLVGEIESASLYIYEKDSGTHEITQGYNSKFGATPAKAIPVDWDNGTELTIVDNPYAYVLGRYSDNQQTVFTVGSNAFTDKFTLPSPKLGVLNFYKDEATPDDVMVATRLTAVVQGRLAKGLGALSGASVAVNMIFAYGTEIATTARIVYFDENPSTLSFVDVHDGMALLMDTDYATKVKYQLAIKNFDWAPRIRLTLATEAVASGGKIITAYQNRDLCNTAILTDDMIRNMHRVAVSSELGIPLLGLKVRTR